ncbi:MAG: MFS transporter, partial [Actinomycetota bacterium]|nr:MFS transporter [Actinomycetota bacterium]
TDGPRRLVAIGFAAVVIGIAGAHLILVSSFPLPLGIALWAVAGFGIGLAYAPLSVTVLDQATPGSEGSATSSLQLTDVLGVALGAGAVGALVDLGDGRGWLPASSLHIGFALTLAVAAVGIVLTRRLPTHLAN